MIIKENYNVPAHAGEHRKYIDRRPIAPCRFYIYDMRSTDIMPFAPAPRRLTRPARALGNRHLIRLAAVRNESWDETPPYCA